MASDIKISLSVEGAQAASAGVSQVSESLEDLQRSQQLAATRAIDFTTKLAGAANAVQSLAGQLGVEGRAAGLLGSIASSSAAMAQLGATLGPQGAVVGGIVGATVPALAALRDGIVGVSERNAEWRQTLTDIELAQREVAASTRDTTRDIEEQSEIVATAAARMRDFVRSLSVEGLRGESEDAAARVSALADELAGVNDQIRNLADSTGADAALRLLELRERASQLTGEINRLSADIASGAGVIAESTSRSGQGDDAYQRLQDSWDRYNEAVADGMRQQNEAKLEAIRLEEEWRSKIEERAQAEIDAALHIKAVEAQRAQEQLEALEERKQRQLEVDDKLRENSERIREEYQRQVEGYQETTGVIVGGLTEALTAIVAGEKSAEEAFKGMLASFLAYIAEQAALKAIFEGAEAIAAFASQRYDQGALHIAAAAGYAAVAVAAGAGSAALSAAPQRPAEPEQGRSDQGGGRGGDIVINWNSPVITSGTRAELGRELQQTIAAGAARYG